MPKFTFPPGTTSKRVLVFIRDTSQTAAAKGLTGLVYNSSGLKMYYAREDDGNAGGNAVTLASATLGTWTSGGFKEKDSTNMPGVYEIGLPNAMLASGSEWVSAMLYGATDMEDVNLEIQLDDLSGGGGGSAAVPGSKMGPYIIQAGTTSKRIEIFVPNTASTTGGGLTGLTYNSSGLKAYYTREDDGNTGATAITLASATLGTYTSGGFTEKDSTNYPGWYELDLPNAVLAVGSSGATWATVTLYGATNMAPVRIEIMLVAYNPMDGTRLGLSALPNGFTEFKKNQAYNGFTFPMFNSSSHQMQSGLTVTCQISKDGGSLANSTNSVTEIGSGVYYINFTASETNCGTMFLKFSASGADDNPYTIVVQP